MEDLVENIVPLYSAHWKMLGIILDVRGIKLDAIAWKKEEVQNYCKEMLEEWLKSNDVPSWRKLLDAVRPLPAIILSS